MPNSTAYMIDLARSGVLARMFDLDNVSHNIANSNTTGFKSARVNFQEILTETTDGAQWKAGAYTRATQRLMGQGALQHTGQPLDVAIQGEGFFAVTLPDGRPAYTRDGAFIRDADSNLVTANGLALDWTGAIPAAAEEVHINPDGTVMVRQGVTWTQAGQINTNRFANPSGLTGYGENLWLESDVSGAPETDAPGNGRHGFLSSGFLEGSNVNMAEEMTHLIALQRAYQLSIRAFQQTDSMIGLAVQLRR